LTRDPRPPVLVLRTFTSFDFEGDDADTYGAQLESLLQPYGPLITLKNDLQKLPPQGPYALDVADSEWQREVLSYMEQSVAIIVFAGFSKGLLWELNEIATRGLLFRTALVIPSSFRTTDFNLAKEMLAGATDPSLESFLRVKEIREVLPLVKPLAERPEFQVLFQKEIHEALVIRWTLNGEPVVFTGNSSTPKAISEALLLSILISRQRSAPEKSAADALSSNGLG
jgi:hypothetical protein